MTGEGGKTIREAARRVGRDVKAVHGDIHALLERVKIGEEQSGDVLHLRRRNRILSIHASTAIEGNPLSLEEVSRLAEGREVMAARRAKAEVLNYLRVLEHIGTFQDNGILSEKNILALHRDVTRDTLDDPVALLVPPADPALRDDP